MAGTRKEKGRRHEAVIKANVLAEIMSLSTEVKKELVTFLRRQILREEDQAKIASDSPASQKRSA